MMRFAPLTRFLYSERLRQAQRQGERRALREAGETVSEHLLSSLSPLTWEHVNLTGDYLWEDRPALDENGFHAIPFSL